MKLGISASLAAHYAGESISITQCWKVTLRDPQPNGTVLGFTALDRDITFGGVTYLAASGFIPQNVETQTKLAVDNTQVIGVLDSAIITHDDLTAGRWDFARVELLQVNWQDPAADVDILMTGNLGEVSIDGNQYTAELRGLTAAYAHNVGEVYTITCRAALGDARCGVNLAPLTVTGTLSAVSAGGLVLSDPARTEPGPIGGKAITNITRDMLPLVSVAAHGFVAQQIIYIAGVLGMLDINGDNYVIATVPNANSFTLAGVDTSDFGAYTSGGTATPQGDAGYFDYGIMTMLTGASAGLAMEVKAYSPATLTLQLQFPRGVAPGDTYSLVAGCGKRFAEDCVARHANGDNFRGEPHLPGIDRSLRIGGQ